MKLLIDHMRFSFKYKIPIPIGNTTLNFSYGFSVTENFSHEANTEL